MKRKEVTTLMMMKGTSCMVAEKVTKPTEKCCLLSLKARHELLPSSAQSVITYGL